MRRRPFNTLRTLLAAAAMLASVWVIAWPADADAFVDHEALWGRYTAPTSCVNMAQLSSHGQLSLVGDGQTEAAGSTNTEPTNCDGTGEAASPGNFCFKGAGAPHSLRPALMAELERANRRADEAADGAEVDTPAETAEAVETVAAVQKMLGVDSARHFAALQLASGLQLPPPRKRAPEPTSSCTIQHPDNCRSMPPLPGELQLDVLPPIAQLDHDGRPGDHRPAPLSETSPLTRLSVGPSAGHDSPPDKPPRAH